MLGGCRVGEILLGRSEGWKLFADRITYTTREGTVEIDGVDGVVLALGCKGMESVVNASPALARLPVFSRVVQMVPVGDVHALSS